MKRRFETVSDMMAQISPTGTRDTVITMGYRYTWPFGISSIDQIIIQARALRLHIEKGPETGWIRRDGEIKVEGPEGTLYWFFMEIQHAEYWED